MPKPLSPNAPKAENTVHALFEDDFESLKAGLKIHVAAFLEARGFKAGAGQCVVLPVAEGKAKAGLMQAWFGLGARKAYNPMVFRGLSSHLPKGTWALTSPEGLDPVPMHAAFGIGVYGFDRYKAEAGRNPKTDIKLDTRDLTPEARKSLRLMVAAHDTARDLINTPAQDMGPQHIEAKARAIAETYGAQITVFTGDDLLKSHYPAVHAVGRAAAAGREPRFIEMSWTPYPAPKTGRFGLNHVVLVGKGVSFDTGGLDLKPSSGMALMKKDMGGAAHALALGEWIMASHLEVRLTILIPAVENSVSGDSFRPGDILASRAGISIEVGNTDAEGRLILADALTRAGELDPTLTIDFATLTGAARVALGPELVPFYCDDEEIVRRLEIASLAENDPIWRMPLWDGYKDALESDIADIRNDPQGWAQAGSVTAGLFLQRFAPKTGSWLHFDIYGWNPRNRPGYPLGAEAQTLRAVYRLIEGL
jgi:leucyl aminopeptidase